MTLSYDKFRTAVRYVSKVAPVDIGRALRLTQRLGRSALEPWYERARKAGGLEGFEAGARQGPGEALVKAGEAGLAAATGSPTAAVSSVLELAAGAFRNPERRVGTMPKYPTTPTNPTGIRGMSKNPPQPWTIDVAIEGVLGTVYKRSLGLERPIVEIGRQVAHRARQNSTARGVLEYVEQAAAYRPMWAAYWMHVAAAMYSAGHAPEDGRQRLYRELTTAITSGIERADYGPGRAPADDALSAAKRWITNQWGRKPRRWRLEEYVGEINCRFQFSRNAWATIGEQWITFDADHEIGRWGSRRQQLFESIPGCTPVRISKEHQIDFALRSERFYKTVLLK